MHTHTHARACTHMHTHKAKRRWSRNPGCLCPAPEQVLAERIPQQRPVDVRRDQGPVLVGRQPQQRGRGGACWRPAPTRGGRWLQLLCVRACMPHCRAKVPRAAVPDWWCKQCAWASMTSLPAITLPYLQAPCMPMRYAPCNARPQLAGQAGQPTSAKLFLSVTCGGGVCAAACTSGTGVWGGGHGGKRHAVQGAPQHAAWRSVKHEQLWGVGRAALVGAGVASHDRPCRPVKSGPAAQRPWGPGAAAAGRNPSSSARRPTRPRASLQQAAQPRACTKGPTQYLVLFFWGGGAGMA